MRKNFFSVLFTFFCAALLAQHHANNWNFGILTGIIFSSGNPVVLSAGTLSTNEGCNDVVEVLDVCGRVVEQFKINWECKNLSVGKTLQARNYFIRLSNKKEIKTVKVIKIV